MYPVNENVFGQTSGGLVDQLKELAGTSKALEIESLWVVD